jgi:predicted  nucleic acid-binding Zn-ribbon protein
MGGDLKGQWGVGDPAPVSSDKQSQQFQATFQKEVSTINEHLQYTSVNAEEARNTPLVGRRDALINAFQGTLPKIDPKDPTKAKGAIDKVLGDVKALDAEVTKFRKEAEKAFNDWTARQPKFDEAVHHVEELETWEDSKAPPLRSLVDGIRKLTDDKKYAVACKTFDQLVPKLQPIYDEYLKQKAAKEKYEPALEALKPHLGETQTSSYQKLEPAQKDIGSNQSQMETAAKAKNYVDALRSEEVLSKQVEDYLKKVAELGKQKKAYEDAVAPLQPRLTTGPQPHPKVEQMYQDINSVRGQMEDAAKKEDFDEALKYATDLKAKLDTFDAALKELEDQKKAFDDVYNPLKKQLEEDEELNKSTTAEMEPLKKEIVVMQAQIDKSAQAEEYADALKLANNLKQNYEAYKAADSSQKFLVKIPTGNCKGEYRLTAKEIVLLKMELAAVAAEKGIPPLKQKAEFYSGWYTELEKVANGSKIISAIVNFYGGASLSTLKTAIDAQQASIDALSQAVASNPKGADEAYKKAIETINHAGDQIKEYMDKTEEGGNTLITHLQYVEGSCFAIAAVAGGIALAGAGAGLAATAGANAVSGAVWEGLHSGIDSAAHNAIMTGEKPITTEEMEKRAAMAALKGGAEGVLNAVGGQLGKLVEPMAGLVIIKLGCTNPAAIKFVEKAAAGGIAEAFKTLLKNEKDVVNGNWSDLVPKLAAAFIQGALMKEVESKLGGEHAPKFISADQAGGKALDTYFEEKEKREKSGKSAPE